MKKMSLIIRIIFVLYFTNSYAQQYFLQKFDTDPVLSPVQMPNTWYVDRYAPAGFQKEFFDGDNRLKHSISTSDAALNRPPGQQGTFYNTQGRKYDLNNPVYTSISADLYIASDWQTNHRRADMWATMGDNFNVITRYPIIGFANTTGSNPTWRVWTNSFGWINLPDPPGFSYGNWYNLRIELTPVSFNYYIDGLLVYTDTDIAGSTKFLNMIIQAYNFGDPTLPPAQYALESYDVYWDNIAAGALLKITPNLHFQCSLDTITLNVDIEGVNDLFAFSITVKYDNSVLKLSQIQNGTFLESNPNSSAVLYQSFPAIASAYDSIIVDAAVLGLAGSSGSGRLFSLKFVPLIRDTAIVKINAFSLRNSLNQEIFASTDSAKIVISPDVSVELTIENQSVIGSDFFFDVYLKRTGTTDLYLSNANFILYFNDLFFSSPSLLKVGSVPGYCTFKPTISTPANDLATRTLYFNNTSTSIITVLPSVKLLKISLNIPAPIDQTTFDTQIAKIDNSPVTHRLGRFKITGIWYTLGSSGLSWRLLDSPKTYINTFASVDPWCDYSANINAIDPPNIPLPVEMKSLVAKQFGNVIKLNWVTISETDNFGFEVERRLSTETNWNKLEFIPGAGNSNSIKEYSFTDRNLSSSGNYFYRLKQINADGTFSYTTQVEVNFSLVLEYSLNQNYPNPFNPSTKITYAIPQDGFVSLVIVNTLGERIETLVSEFQTAGIYTLEVNANRLNSGVYFYKIEVNDFSAVKKMIVLK